MNVFVPPCAHIGVKGGKSYRKVTVLEFVTIGGPFIQIHVGSPCPNYNGSATCQGQQRKQDTYVPFFVVCVCAADRFDLL